MKTSIFTFALAVLITLGISLNITAQNLVVNGDMESWTGGVPDSWVKAENITQESTTIHGGTYSAKHTSDATTKDLMQEISGIEGGQEYTISYWYFDNDPMARTRIWSYWLSGGSTLPDNADELRPNSYSEDNANWQQFTVTLTAPASADAFRFEVRVYKQDNQSGGSVFYDDFEFTGDITIYPEPSNYPTGFGAIANGNDINLSWTDATGAQLPSKYIIFASTDAGNLPVPVDGTPVADDLDLSDGSGALNVAYGNQAALFSALEGNTTYYFAIYPYTNSGANIDFKTDGTAPTASATTANVSIIESENFDDVTFGNWTTISVTGDQEWVVVENYGVNGTPCAKMTGYDGQPYANEDWLISPALNLDNYTGEVLNFQNAMNYSGNPLELKVSTNYSGSGDPNAADWTDLTFNMSGGSWAWTESGAIDLSAFSGSAVYVAFKFTSTDSESATWEVDEIVITGEMGGTPDPEPTNYPTDFEAVANLQNINLTWTDATGDQLPDAYIIFAGTTSSLPAPEDGTPVMNDLDLSDGNGALNVGFGAQQATFAGLDANTTYYFSIYPYTNSGADIDFKNDGTAPTAEATTGEIPNNEILSQDFNDYNFGDWTVYSVTGDQEWYIDSIHGVDGTACAKMSGYAGQPFANEDWLISPAMNLDNYINETLTFFNAMNYSGNDMELKISTDYDGSSDPNTASWTDLSYTMSGGSWAWTESGNIDISGFNGPAVYIAFKFTSTDTESATWEVDNILVTGDEGGSPDPEPSNYPESFAAEAAGVSINLSWTDATGEQLPSGYIIFAGIDGNLPVPDDGIPVPDDTDLSDGSGAINVSYGVMQTSFGNLEPNTEYFFSIYPYTNSGSNIDYKNDGSAPTASATTAEPTIEVIESEDFNEVSFGNWTPVSVTGDQEWIIAEIHGVDGTPCAKMSGYDGEPFENDDWLISPPLNLNDYSNETLDFFNAMNYSGNPLELKISTDYDGGGDPYSATWTTLDFNASPGSWEWTESGTIDISSYNGTAVYIAFHFTCTSVETATWEIDNIVIKGEKNVGTGNPYTLLTNVSLFPNPSTGIVNVNMSNSAFDVMKVYALTGNLVKEFRIDAISNTIDLSELKKGIYFVSFESSKTNQTVTKKLILK
jgi:hypothetical protein